MVTTQPSAYSAVTMSVPARMRNGAPRLTMSTAAGIGGSVSRAYGGAPLQVVKVVDQPVQRRSRHSGHILHAHSIADAPPASRAGMVQPRYRQHRAGADPGRAPGRGHLRGIRVLRERWRILGPPVSPCDWELWGPGVRGTDAATSTCSIGPATPTRCSEPCRSA